MKFKSMLLALIMIVASFNFTALTYASDEVTHSYSELILLDQLGITEGIDGDLNKEIDRASFVAMVVRSVNMNIPLSSDKTFTDVTSHPFEKEIYIAKALGITNGTSETTFSPDSPLSLMAGIKMAVSALDYSRLAMAKGGYPVGYMQIARQIDLYDVSENLEKCLTYKEAYSIIYNMLTCDKATFTEVSNGELQVTTTQGVNLLSENFGFKSKSGILKTAGYLGVDEEYLDYGRIGVDAKTFKTSLDASTYLGYKVTLWYDAEDEIVYAFDVDSDNKEVVVNSDDVLGYENKTLSVDTLSGKEEKYKFDTITFLYNGRAISYDESDFLRTDTTYRLIDNDSDGKYEFVIANHKEYFVVRGINALDKTIYDAKSNLQNINFDSDDCDYRVLVNGIPSDFDNIQRGMICEVYMSKDKKVCSVLASQNAQNLEVDELTKDKMVSDGKTYEFTSYFDDNCNLDIKPGKTYRFYISADSKIIDAALLDDFDMQYGIFFNYRVNPGMEDSAVIKIFELTETLADYHLSKDIYLDGIEMESTDARVKQALFDGQNPRYQLIKYKVEKDEVTIIDTCKDDFDKWDVDSPKDSKNSLTRYIWDKDVFYRQGITTPHGNLSGAVLVRVPTDFDKSSGSQWKEYTEDDFGIWDASNVGGSGGSINIDVFDFDEYYIPKIAFVRSEDSTNYHNFGEYFVMDVSENAVNDEGDKIVKLKVFTNGKYQEFGFKPSDYAKLSVKPTAGDIVRFMADNDRIIELFQIDADYDENYIENERDIVEVNYTSPIEPNIADSHTYITGTVYKVNDTHIVIKEQWDNGGSYYFASPQRTLALPFYDVEIILYNNRTKHIKEVGIDSFVTEFDAGSIDATKVCIRLEYGAATKVYIYEN